MAQSLVQRAASHPLVWLSILLGLIFLPAWLVDVAGVEPAEPTTVAARP